MKIINITVTKALLISLGVLLLSNAMVLSHAIYNRSGEPESSIQLTERELRLPYQHRNKENSGISLQFVWQTAQRSIYEPRYYRSFTINVTAEKLNTLGFDRDKECGKLDKRRRFLARKGWIALEYNGASYSNQIESFEINLQDRQTEIGPSPGRNEQKDLKHLSQKLENLRHHGSRLYAIEVSLTKSELTQNYPGSSYMFLPALIRFGKACGKEPGVHLKPLIKKIHVPKHLRATVENLPLWTYNTRTPPRYSATIAFGKLGEPWLIELTSLTE